MRNAVAKRLRAEIRAARKDYPNMDTRFAYKEAKKDYGITPWRNRDAFSIFDK